MTPTLPRQINTAIIYFLLSLILFLCSNQKIVFRLSWSQMSPIFWIQVAVMSNYLFYHLPARLSLPGNQNSGELLPAVSTNYPGLQAAPVSGSSAMRSRGSETKMMSGVMCNVSVTLHCYITGHVSSVGTMAPFIPGRVPYVQPRLHPVSTGWWNTKLHSARGKPCPGNTRMLEIHLIELYTVSCLQFLVIQKKSRLRRCDSVIELSFSILREEIPRLASADSPPPLRDVTTWVHLWILNCRR